MDVKRRNLFLTGALTLVLVGGGVVLAQGRLVTINHGAHPNLADAQMDMQHAYDKIDAAQQADQHRLGGHADKAKQLLMEASGELKAAAEYADHGGR